MSDIDDIKDIMDNKAFKPRNDNPIQRIKVIGVGGGGNNAVINMHKHGIQDVSFVLLNTDRQVLDSFDIPTKVQIGPGRGAGGDPNRAREYAEENALQIAELFDNDTDMVFITAGMGGGTGTGAAPVVARIAKEKGILTVGIVTIPFDFEGRRKIDKALKGADEMAKNVDSLLVINNQRLTEIYKELDIFNAFAKADDTLLNATKSITDIITARGVINRDFNDVDTTLRDGGTAIISTGYGEGPDRVRAAIEDALHSPLLEDTDIFASKKLLMVLYVSDESAKHPFNMKETEALSDFIQSIDSNVDVMWGLYKQPDLEDKVRITLLASGFNVSVKTDGIRRTTVGAGSPRTAPSQTGTKTDYMQGVQAKVLDPKTFDAIDDDGVRELENEPAINRSPRFKRYGIDVSGENFRDVIARKPVTAEHEDAPKTPDGALLLSFDDID